MNNQYDVNYFIEKFSAIPARQWTTCTFCDNDGRRCAVGHFLKLEVPDGKSLWDFNHNGRVLREETRIKLRALAQLFNDCNDMSKAQRTLYAINNGDDFRYKQRSPKQRILTALRDIKARAEAALDAYETRPLLPALPHDSGASSGTSQSRRFPARPVKVISASGPALTSVVPPDNGTTGGPSHWVEAVPSVEGVAS